ncbi:Cu(I)-responsive transcriptional regulator [Roseomonas eburnea]|uniref:Cu(I)-responsive transcriptional regulator n=1 Tax=Neoroseomonas eburnea TaxID=1346889 RepID=A0A9X9XGR3_9PROT|nr:Cu(I)-responsive transcriptional regulator [Neoroseomonas eburnea]MBR0682899.1 Cu(I)-responsive transcriptional regulator [Neoroseomonas eburnea]
MNIGDAAKVSGVSVKMIRHYEAIGLLPAATRTESGYRVYRPEDVHALRFIRNARDLGFPLAEIEELLGLWRDRARASAEVKRLALAHVAAIDEKLKALQAMGDTLRELAASCHGDHRPDCPILKGISGARTLAPMRNDGGAHPAERLRHASITRAPPR